EEGAVGCAAATARRADRRREGRVPRRPGCHRGGVGQAEQALSMATLQDVRRRIRSVQSTQKITRAMKLVAAAKLRRAQERVVEARPYAFKMAALVGAPVPGGGGDKHPLLVRREGPRKLYVVIPADKGLCGAFNSNVVRRALALLRGASEGTATVLAVGRKARDFFRRRQWPLRGERVGFLDRLGFDEGRALAGGPIQACLAGGGGEGWLGFTGVRA